MRREHHPQWKGPHYHPRHKIFRPLAVMTLFTGLLVLPSFFLAQLCGAVAGRPVTWRMQFAVTVLWFLAVYVTSKKIFGMILELRRRQGFVRSPNVFEETIEAIDRIGSGDYDIHIDVGGHQPFEELAGKINKLAMDLSSMEQMRQEFVSNVSHEIQSPLTSISGFATLLKKEDLPREQRLHYLEVIEAESRRLSKMSDNLLKLSVLESEQSPVVPAGFQLDAQIRDILLLLEPQWEEKQLELEVDLEPVEFTGDKDLLSQVWINLLHNAIKFTPSQGRITVSLTRKCGRIIGTISDTGSGISEESMLHIFERFYKADKARDRTLGGNGLGLALAKKIVDLHSGKISVQSRLGEGTTFTVSFPTEE